MENQHGRFIVKVLGCRFKNYIKDTKKLLLLCLEEGFVELIELIVGEYGIQ